MRSCFAALAVLVTALCLVASPAAHAGDSDAGQAALMNVIAQASQRLALADPVARYKWLKSQAITDVPRETALLAQVAQRAPGYGVDPQFAQTFFRDQIDANKRVQQALIDEWRQAPPSGASQAPDLAETIRPQLDQLTTTLLAALARVQPIREADDCPVRLAHSLTEWQRLNLGDGLHQQALRQALQHLCAGGGVGAIA